MTPLPVWSSGLWPQCAFTDGGPVDTLGPEGDLDRLFAVGGHGGARVANLGEVDDSEPYLGLDRPGAGSHTVTFWEPVNLRRVRQRALRFFK
jgi:hypothetical protein